MLDKMKPVTILQETYMEEIKSIKITHFLRGIIIMYFVWLGFMIRLVFKKDSPN